VSAALGLLASPESTELAVVMIWSLSALLFAFTHGGPPPGSEFPLGIAMN
jgi:hypothetical protein